MSVYMLVMFVLVEKHDDTVTTGNLQKSPRMEEEGSEDEVEVKKGKYFVQKAVNLGYSRYSVIRMHSKALHRWGVRGEKTGKHEKVEVKRKWWVLARLPYSLQVNMRQSLRVETTGIDHQARRRIQGADTFKG